ncbi:GAK system ATP-grasp enzyme [Marinobacterium litorale]|uniref:GAK system ATP-grasp enzyme n=1 Tax=Marinobacterium litorale TaxID=404770 RepID=UPI0004022129|nr:GAK system ATP-grasp enzyme [Marinobacterium litorale]
MTEPKIAVVGVPGKWSTEVLADALEDRTGYRQVIDMANVALDLGTGQLKQGDLDLCELDALIVKKISGEYSPTTMDRLELLRFAEAKGVRVFSSADRMLKLIDRASCTLTLANQDIPMPPTLLTEDIDAALSAIQRYQEAILKPLFSTKARGMIVLDASQGREKLRRRLERFQESNPMLYIQKKLNLNGQDLGMIFLGGRYLGAYARVSRDGAWDTTINSGGRYAPFEADDALIELAQRAQAPFGLDFTTVDVAITDQGPVVFEVSAFGGFKGALKGANIDAAKLYSNYVLEQLHNGQ